jgi:hypothetical protein
MQVGLVDQWENTGILRERERERERWAWALYNIGGEEERDTWRYSVSS